MGDTAGSGGWGENSGAGHGGRLTLSVNQTERKAIFVG